MREDRRANLALSENGFLFDAMTGHTYTLNRTGAHIVRQILAGTKPDELPSKLVEDFDVSLDIAAHILVVEDRFKITQLLQDYLNASGM